VDPLSLREFEECARRALDPGVYHFFAGGADDETTLRANEAAWARIGLVPRVLRGPEPRRLETELLGCRAALPVLLAPTAFHRLAHPEGERATARAAAGAGAIMIASMAATVAVEEIGEAFRGGVPGAGGFGAEGMPGAARPRADGVSGAARPGANGRSGAARPGGLWFQIYLQRDLGFTASVVARAEAAGCGALVVSVDSPVFGRRERDLRTGFLDLPPGLECPNMSGRPIGFWAGLTWDHLDWLRSVTRLPIVLKGIAHPADARTAVERGADALIVSNHGGRQLDTVPASAGLLPAVARAVGGAVPVLVDGGIRRGTDVVKALAMGATAVAVGRPVLWGLATAGENGVARMLELLRDELDRALALCGCATPADAGPELLESRC
jgi:4-hydroxymandelate oxidase